MNRMVAQFQSVVKTDTGLSKNPAAIIQQLGVIDKQRLREKIAVGKVVFTIPGAPLTLPARELFRGRGCEREMFSHKALDVLSPGRKEMRRGLVPETQPYLPRPTGVEGTFLTEGEGIGCSVTLSLPAKGLEGRGVSRRGGAMRQLVPSAHSAKVPLRTPERLYDYCQRGYPVSGGIREPLSVVAGREGTFRKEGPRRKD